MKSITVKVDGERIYKRIFELAEIGKVGETGVSRFALTEEDKKAQQLVMSWMKEAHMEVRHDNFGNLIGRKEGNDPNLKAVVLGSHIDSVPNGGRFDGVIGVLGAIEVVQSIVDFNISHEHPIEVIAFSDEEGSRFSDGLFGSRGMVGLVNKEHLTLKDDKGVSRYEALKNFGFNINPDQIDNSVRKPNEIKCYFEMHIEQGPFLEAVNKPVGIVKAIAGPAWFSIHITGEAGHAGTVPMKYRKDPMAGTAEIVKEIEMICKSDIEESLVGTIGKIQAFPGGRNVIPQSVEFSLDLRDVELEKRNENMQKIVEVIKRVCDERNLQYEIKKALEVPPVQCSENIVHLLKEANEELNLNAPIMISGAGHDAMYMAEITDIGMIFVRCKDGISHNPKEWASKEDIEIGTQLLLNAVLKTI